MLTVPPLPKETSGANAASSRRDSSCSVVVLSGLAAVGMLLPLRKLENGLDRMENVEPAVAAGAIEAGAAVQRVARTVGVEQQVVPVAAADDVVAGATVEFVIAAAAVDRVVAGVAEYSLIAVLSGGKRVVPGAEPERADEVIASKPFDGV